MQSPPEPSLNWIVSGSPVSQIRTGQRGESECTETNPASWIAHWPTFTQRLLFGSWTPASPLPSEATRASHSPDEIDEYAFVVVLQIGQVVGEGGEVVADASLQVLANVMIDRGQRAAAALTYIR